MSKNKNFFWTTIGILGVVVTYANYMAKKDEFSDNTKDVYDDFINNAKNVGKQIKRTYISIGKEDFDGNTKKLGENAVKLAQNTKNLVGNAAVDMFDTTKNKIQTMIKNKKSSSLKKTIKTKQKPVSKSTSKKARQKSKNK